MFILLPIGNASLVTGAKAIRPTIIAAATRKVVASILLTNEIQKSLGIDIGYEPWLVSMQIDDENVAKAIKSGACTANNIPTRSPGRRAAARSMAPIGPAPWRSSG